MLLDLSDKERIKKNKSETATSNLFSSHFHIYISENSSETLKQKVNEVWQKKYQNKNSEK